MPETIPAATVRDLIQAITEAIAVPRPADYADQEKFKAAQRERVLHMQGALGHTVEQGCTLIGIEAVTAVMRDTAAADPGYKPVSEEAGRG